MFDADAKLCRVSGGIIMKVAYGWTVKDTDDYFVGLMEESFTLTTEIVKPGRWLVDVFPIREAYLFYDNIILTLYL